MVPTGPNGIVDETYGGYHISYEVKKLMYEKTNFPWIDPKFSCISLFGVVASPIFKQFLILCIYISHPTHHIITSALEKFSTPYARLD